MGDSSLFPSWPTYLKVTLSNQWVGGATIGDPLESGDVIVMKKVSGDDANIRYSEDGTTVSGPKNRLGLSLRGRQYVDSSTYGYFYGYWYLTLWGATDDSDPTGYTHAQGTFYGSSLVTGVTDTFSGLSMHTGAVWSVIGSAWSVLTITDSPFTTIGSTWSQQGYSWTALTPWLSNPSPWNGGGGGGNPVFSAVSEATEAEWNEAQGLGGPPVGGLAMMGAGR